jgi:hypothetical protein
MVMSVEHRQRNFRATARMPSKNLFFIGGAGQFLETRFTLEYFSSVQREPHHKTGANRGLNPHVTTVVQNSLAGER